MSITAPETKLRHRINAALEAEFASEGIKFLDDKLHDSKGRDGALGATYPGSTAVPLGNELVLEPTIYIQLFGQWTAEVDPNLSIDPTPIEEWAERVRRALKADGNQGSTGADEHLWYYQITRIDFPPDPGGNISRLVATVVGKAQNAALVETTL